jgi:hypothetical protein
MIVQWFVQGMASLFASVLGLLPSWSAPSFLTSLSSGLASIAGYTASTSAWIPWQAVAIAVPILVAAASAALLVKGVRMVLSLFTGGGGSSA